MALTSRTLTGDLRNLPGVPYDAPALEAWVVSSKTVIVDGDANRVHVGTRVRLPLVGSTFTVSLPDSGEAGVLYSLVAMWVEPAGARQVGPSKLGDFHLTANADMADVLITTGGDLPQTVVDELRDEIAAVALPPGGAEGQVLGKSTSADHDVEWVDQSGGGGGGGPVTWGSVTGKPATFPPTIGPGATDAVAGNDSRLTDARTPTAHGHVVGDVSGLGGTLTSLDVAIDGKADATRTVNGQPLTGDVVLDADDVGAAPADALPIEGTTGHLVAIAGADGSMTDSGIDADDLVRRVTALAADDTGAGLRFDLTYPGFDQDAPNTFERWVNAVLYAGANEWGAFRSWRAPFADAAVRVIIPQGQTAWDTTPAIHLNDRRTGAPTPNLYARTWTGKLIRNGTLVREVYRWQTGDADPTAGGTIPLPPNVSYVLYLGTAEAIPSWAPSDSVIIRGLAEVLSVKGNPNVDLASATEVVGSYTVVNDSSPTDPWPNRLDLTYRHGGATADRLVQWWNEYLEWRGMPAKNSTVGWRIFAAPDSAEYAARNDTTMVAEVANWRNGAGRATVWGVTKTGQQTVAGDWRAGSVVTLNADQDESDLAAAPPPPGTLIVRKLP